MTADHMYSRQNWENLPQYVQTPLFQKPQTLSQTLIQFFQSTQNFTHFQNKNQVHSLNIYEVIECRKCGDFNDRKFLFYNIVWESTCFRVQNTVEIDTAALLFQFFINNKQIQLKKISVSQIYNLSTVS